jgi:phospholipid transport system transporter-binding protein
MAQLRADGHSGTWLLDGELTVDHVARMAREGRRAINGGGAELIFDLSGVKRADSAGLALLIDWMAWAERRGQRLRFTQISTDIDSLARLSEVSALLHG